MKFGERASRSLHKLRVYATRAQCLLQIPMWFSLCVRTGLPPPHIFTCRHRAHTHTHTHTYTFFIRTILYELYVGTHKTTPPPGRRASPPLFSHVQRDQCARSFSNPLLTVKKNSIEIRMCARAKELYYLAIQINGHFIWQYKKHFLIKFLFLHGMLFNYRYTFRQILLHHIIPPTIALRKCFEI